MLPVSPELLGAMAAPMLNDPETLSGIKASVVDYLAGRGIVRASIEVEVRGTSRDAYFTSEAHHYNRDELAEWLIAEIARTLDLPAPKF